MPEDNQNSKPEFKFVSVCGKPDYRTLKNIDFGKNPGLESIKIPLTLPVLHYSDDKNEAKELPTDQETMQAIEDFCQGKTLSPDTEDRLPTHEEACKALDDFYSKLPQIPEAFTQMQFHLEQLGAAMTVAANNYQKCVRKCVEHHVDNQKYLVQPLVMAEQSVDDLREELQKKEFEIASLKLQICPEKDAMLVKALDRQNELTRKVNHYHRLYQKEKGKAGRYVQTRDHAIQSRIAIRRLFATAKDKLERAEGSIAVYKNRLKRHGDALDKLQGAFLDLKCCYDVDGETMKNSDAAVKIKAAINLLKGG